MSFCRELKFPFQGPQPLGLTISVLEKPAQLNENSSTSNVLFISSLDNHGQAMKLGVQINDVIQSIGRNKLRSLPKEENEM